MNSRDLPSAIVFHKKGFHAMDVRNRTSPKETNVAFSPIETQCPLLRHYPFHITLLRNGNPKFNNSNTTVRLSCNIVNYLLRKLLWWAPEMGHNCNDKSGYYFRDVLNINFHRPKLEHNFSPNSGYEFKLKYLWLSHCLCFPRFENFW